MNLTNLPKWKSPRFWWRRIYGLGIAWEILNIVSDDMEWRGRKAAVKVFLGPLMVRFDVPIERVKPTNFGDPKNLPYVA
jgi:hypothetical protein